MSIAVSGKDTFRFVIIAPALLLTCWGIYYYWNYTVEDAFISFRYVDNFISGKGLVYNPGERVEGYTNFLWVICLSVLRLFGGFPDIARWLGAFFSLMSIVILYFYRSKDKEMQWAGPAVALVLAASPGFHYWSVAGLETSLFIFLLIGAIIIDQRDRPGNSFMAGFVFGLSTLTRPEGILFFLLYLLGKYRDVLKERKRLMAYLAGYAIIVVPHELFRLYYYHEWIPNTFWVKSKRFRGAGIAYIRKYAAMTGFWLVPASLLGVFFRKTRNLVLPFIIPAYVYFFYVFHIGGDWMPMGRFLVPFIPLAAFAAVTTISTLANNKKRFILLFLAANCITSLVSMKFDIIRWKESHYVDNITWLDTQYANWKLIGTWLHRHVSEDALLCTGLGGIIPYYSGLRNLDKGGLNNKEIARIVYRSPNKTVEEKRINKVILREKPDVLLDDSSSFNILHPTQAPDVIRNTWSLIKTKAFKESYSRRRINVGKYYFILFIRNDFQGVHVE